MREYDVIIIGAGPAGLSAALAAHRRGRPRIAVVDRLPQPGGILPQCFHKGFGLREYGEELTGAEYAERLLSEVDCTAAEFLCGTEVLDLGGNGTVTVSGRGEVRQLKGSAVILASGCRERSIGSLPIYGTRPAGVFTAGSVQRMINLHGYRVGKKVFVLGSGDVGMIVSHHLTRQGARVEGVLEIRDRPGGLSRNKARYLDSNDIPLITGCTITRLHGEGRLEAVSVCRVDAETLAPIFATQRVLPCDTLVTSVGLIPETELLRGHDAPLISEPWLFICGNARRVHSLVDSVVLEGDSAGTAAADYALKLRNKL